MGSTGLDLKTGFHGLGLAFIELLKLAILDLGFTGFGSNYFLDGWFWSRKAGSGYWIGFGLDLDSVFAGIGYQSTSDTNVYGMIRLYNCTIARFQDYGKYGYDRILS